jgi:hypothetical protein
MSTSANCILKHHWGASAGGLNFFSYFGENVAETRDRHKITVPTHFPIQVHISESEKDAMKIISDLGCTIDCTEGTKIQENQKSGSHGHLRGA